MAKFLRLWSTTFRFPIHQKIKAEWDTAAKDIPADVLESFQRVAETYDGEAIALAEQQQGSEMYTCSGCFMSLRLEIINQLMTKDEVADLILDRIKALWERRLESRRGN